MPKTRTPAKPRSESDEAPAQANAIKPMVWGFFISLLLAILPIGLIVRGLVNLAMMLVRPVLLFLGLMKAYEEFERRRKKS